MKNLSPIGARSASKSGERAAPDLAQLFADGLSKIETKRCDNLFKDLDSRTLTQEEEDIISQRVALQRRMLEEYEKRENARKIKEVLSVCPDLTEEEADCALKQHGYREDDAAAALTSGIAFKRKVQVMCGNTNPAPAARPLLLRCQTRSAQLRSGSTVLVGPRMPRVSTTEFLKHVGDDVFVGTFRGKGWEQYRNLPRPQLRSRSPPPASGSSQAHRKTGRKRGSETQADAQATPPEPRPGSAALARRALTEPNQDLPPSPPPSVRRRRSGRLNPGHTRSDSAAEGAAGPASFEATVAADSMEVGNLNTAVIYAATEDDMLDKNKSETDAAVAVGRQGSDAPGCSSETALAASDVEDPQETCTEQSSPEQRITVSSQERPEEALECAEHDLGHGEAGSAAADAELPQQASRQQEKQPSAGNELVMKPDQASFPQPPVPKRQRGMRRLRKQTSAILPWAKQDPGSSYNDASADPRQGASDPAVHQLEGTGKKAVGAADEQFPAEAAPRVKDAIGEAQQPPAAESEQAPEEAMQVTKQTPDGNTALHDHQVAATASSTEASGGKAAAEKSRAKSGSKRGEALSDNAQGGVHERPKRQRRASAKATEALINIALAADMQGWTQSSSRWTRKSAATSPDSKRVSTSHTVQHSPRSPRQQRPATAAAAPLVNKPRLGRVKRCSSKQVELIEVGFLRLDPGWHNKGYIFPDGFCTRTVFRSSVELDQLCMHTCTILGEGGLFWPAPTFRIVALDRPNDELDARSPTGAWNAILTRINNEIEHRRKQGQDLPPPPKTAIAGPEYFGLTHPEVLQQIEALDPDRLCTDYWDGKEDRMAYGQFYGVTPEKKGPPGSASATSAASQLRPVVELTGGAPRRRRGRPRAGAEGGAEAEDGAEEQYGGNRWSGVDRAQRARRRHGDDGGRPADDAENPLPAAIDPITLEPVVTPAISPFGHVMGLATWNAVLAEQGKCPFTQQPLRRDQITVLTKSNFERFKDRIVQC